MALTPPHPAFSSRNLNPETPSEKWTKTQAREYFTWLMREKDSRVDFLLQIAGLGSAISSTEALRGLQSWIFDFLSTSGFWLGASRSDVTTEGHVVVADTGLLFARALMDRDPRLDWALCWDPDRRFIWRGLPVIEGFNNEVVCEPISIVYTTFFRGIKNRAEPAFAEMLEIWLGFCRPRGDA
jgi:hypothetical protein